MLEQATDPSEMAKYIKRINHDRDEMESVAKSLVHCSSLDEFSLRFKNETIANVLSNAIQHAAGKVVVHVKIQNWKSKEATVCITVDDDGRGISDNDRTYVTKPFWSGSEDSAIKGHGIEKSSIS